MNTHYNIYLYSIYYFAKGINLKPVLNSLLHIYTDTVHQFTVQSHTVQSAPSDPRNCQCWILDTWSWPKFLVSGKYFSNSMVPATSSGDSSHVLILCYHAVSLIKCNFGTPWKLILNMINSWPRWYVYLVLNVLHVKCCCKHVFTSNCK